MRVKDFHSFIKEEHEQLIYLLFQTPKKVSSEEIIEDTKDEKNKKMKFGWIYKKASELKSEIMLTDSEKTLNRKVKSLVDKGFLYRRNNPIFKYDRTYQYRINSTNIVQALIKQNYILSEYAVDLTSFNEILKILNTNNIFLNKPEDAFLSKQTLNKIAESNDFNTHIAIIKNKFNIEIKDIFNPENPTESPKKDLNTSILDPNLDLKEDFNLKIIDILKNLKSNVTEAAYNTWIHPLFSTAFLNNNILIIKCPNDSAKDIIEQRYYFQIKRAIESASNYQFKLIL